MRPVATLVEALALRAQEAPEASALRYGEHETGYGELWKQAGRFGAGLLGCGFQPGEPLVLALPNGPEFFVAFYGALRAGLVPAPLWPGSSAERLEAVRRHCGARAVIVEQSGLTVPEVLEGAGTADMPAAQPEDLCFIQYTSGSTGDPKGVQLSHANVLANLQQLIAGMRITREDVFVSWLPLYHDMGLVLMSMVPFCLGARLILLPTRLTNAHAWLQAIQDHHGTLTAAPDFAYRYVLYRLRDPARYDLSSLRVALDAAEPVRAATIERFERAFGLGHVMVPGYGLAEATVGVSTWTPGAAVAVDARGVVCVGPPFPGIRVRIAGAAAPGEVGEILVHGAATTRGYLRNPAANAALYTEDGHLRTGDLGYLDARGRLYVVGRSKDIILHAGQNLAPQEAEEAAEAIAAVRWAAALGIDRGGVEGEQLHLCAELRGAHGAREALASTAAAIVRRCHRLLGFRPARVLLLAPHSIPRTPNGKLQRSLLKARYLGGSLKAEGAILYPDY